MKQKGFTLIELLAALVFGGLAIAIVIVVAHFVMKFW
jgi:prepilin-type N-terminal cleavage/methylation domain-containing protein